MSFSHLTETAEKILNLYEKMSEESKTFSSSSGFSCNTGCGDCCNNPDIYVTALEMLPLAIEIIFKGEEKKWLIKLQDNENNSCILYNSSSEDKVKGSCSKYRMRGVVCRLFGWSQVRGKTGSELSLCKKIEKKEISAEEIANAPSMELWAKEITDLLPSWSDELLPINKALKLSIEKALLSYQYE